MPEAAVPIELRLALCPFDGAFKPTAEEPLRGETRILKIKTSRSPGLLPGCDPRSLRPVLSPAGRCGGAGLRGRCYRGNHRLTSKSSRRDEASAPGGGVRGRLDRLHHPPWATTSRPAEPPPRPPPAQMAPGAVGTRAAPQCASPGAAGGTCAGGAPHCSLCGRASRGATEPGLLRCNAAAKRLMGNLAVVLFAFC